MGTNYLAILGVTTMTTVMSCSSAKKEYASYELYPVRSGNLVEMEYAPGATKFTLWAPTADEVRLMLYDAGEGGHAYETEKMEPAEDGTWTVTVDKDLLGKFYTFNVKIDDKWQGDTPGINARAVGVNGKRAAIIDWKSTQPEGWESDRRPTLKSAADMIIYEMHHRDFSSDSTSGVKNKGKYLALTERGTMNADKRLTGIDHLRELGITHVHLLPSYDYASVDETKLEENHYNWGYDPLNYNVPDGSYSTDPYQPAVRVKEFKQMVQALHQAGIRVIMDVVYNHTFNTIESNFERTAPGYFYRRKEDGGEVHECNSLWNHCISACLFTGIFGSLVWKSSRDTDYDGVTYGLCRCLLVELQNYRYIGVERGRLDERQRRTYLESSKKM